MAKGAPRRYVLSMLAREALMVALSAAAVGATVAVGGLAVFRERLAEALGTMDVLPGAGATVGLVAGLAALVGVSALAASLVPALGVLKMEPYEAIRRGKTA